MKAKRSRQEEAENGLSKSAKLQPSGNSFGSALKAVLAQPIPKKSTTPILASAKPNPQLLKQREEEKATKEAAKLVVAKHKWFEKEHVIPDAADNNHEKMLLKLATKGIVKLFNAVQSQQQHRLQEKGKSVVAPKPDKLSKNQFIEMLKAGGKSHDDSALPPPDSARSKDQESEDDGEDADLEEDEESDGSDESLAKSGKQQRQLSPQEQDSADDDNESEGSYFSDGNDSAGSD